MPNTQYLDGSMPYGSAAITIDSVAYIVNSFSVTPDVSEAVDFDINGRPARRRVVAGLRPFTAEVQLSASNVAFPQIGDTFTYEVDPNYASEVWVIDTVGASRTNDAGSIRTITLNGKAVLNGSVTAS